MVPPVGAAVADAACALLVDGADVPGTVLRPVDPVTLLGCSPAGDPADVVVNEICGLDGGG